MNVRNFAMVLAVVAMSAGSVFAQGDFFWSTSALNSGATNSAAEINTAETTSGSLYLYYSTQSSELDTGAGLDLSWTNDGVIEFTGAETFDFAVALASDNSVELGVRWGDAFGPVPGDGVTANSVTGLNAFSVVAGDGIVNANDGTGAFLDLGYDAGAEAFLFARVDWQAVGAGETSLVTSAGAIGIVNAGQTVNPAFGAANFSGVPEPTSAGLLALGLVGLVARRRR